MGLSAPEGQRALPHLHSIATGEYQTERVSPFETKPKPSRQAERWLKSGVVPRPGSAGTLKPGMGPGRGRRWYGFLDGRCSRWKKVGGTSAGPGDASAPCRMPGHLIDAGRRESQRREGGGGEAGRGPGRSCRGMHIPFSLKPPVLPGTPLKKGKWPQGSPELPYSPPATQAHLSPRPQACEGWKNTPKPTSDPWAKSCSALAALPRPSSAHRQLPLDFTFQLIDGAAVVVT